MKKSSAWWIICLTISFLVPACITRAQTVPQTLAIADSLFVNQQMDNALYYYQRARYFSKGEARSPIARKMAFAYTATKRYETALEYFDIAANGAQSDSVRWEIQLEKTGLMLLNSEYKRAYSELLSFPDSMPSLWWEQRRQYYLGITLLGLEQWDAAENAFVRLFPPQNAADRQAVHRIFEHRKHKNIKVARVMSMVLPGSGQFYAGHYRSGLNSFLLTGTIATVGVVSALDYGWSGSLWTVNWFVRYYRGGIREAGEAAAARNRAFHQKMIDRISHLMI